MDLCVIHLLNFISFKIFTKHTHVILKNIIQGHYLHLHWYGMLSGFGSYSLEMTLERRRKQRGLYLLP